MIPRCPAGVFQDRLTGRPYDHETVSHPDPDLATPAPITSGTRGLKGLASLEYRAPRELTGKEIEISKADREEMRARRLFGIEPPAHPQSPSEAGPKPITSYRELLVMPRFEVADLFDAFVGVTNKDQQVLMERALVEAEASARKAEIEELKALLVTRSAQWQKLHRSDDKLDKNARERLKREETITLRQKEVEWRTLRSRLLHWETDPRNYHTKSVLVPVTFGEAFDITHQTIERDVEWVPDELRTPKDGVAYYTELMLMVERQIGDDYTVEGYRKVLQLDDDALLYLTEGMTWDGWREWENKVIIQAIVIGLIRPDKDLIEMYPGLGRYIPPDDPHDIDHSMEDKLALKTGGAQYGATIYSAGVHVGRHKNYARKLQDFWKPTQYHLGEGWRNRG